MVKMMKNKSDFQFLLRNVKDCGLLNNHLSLKDVRYIYAISNDTPQSFLQCFYTSTNYNADTHGENLLYSDFEKRYIIKKLNDYGFDVDGYEINDVVFALVRYIMTHILKLRFIYLPTIKSHIINNKSIRTILSGRYGFTIEYRFSGYFRNFLNGTLTLDKKTFFELLEK